MGRIMHFMIHYALLFLLYTRVWLFLCFAGFRTILPQIWP